MSGKIIKVIIFFQITIIALIFNMTFLNIMRTHPFQSSASSIFSSTSQATAQMIETKVYAADARALLIENFIRRYQPKSPLIQYANSFVSAADAHQIDFRLLPAIAMCESRLGVRIPSSDSFNAWGIAVYTSEEGGKKFSNWPTAIEWVSNYIETKFYDNNITEMKDIEQIWAPPSAQTNTWSGCVEQFMEKIQ